MPLNREEFLSKIKLTYKSVHIDSIDADILIREWPAKEIIELTQKYNDEEISQLEFNCRIIVSSFIDENGNEILTMNEVEKLPRKIFSELIQAVNEVNILDLEEAKDNLKKIQIEGSITS